MRRVIYTSCLFAHNYIMEVNRVYKLITWCQHLLLFKTPNLSLASWAGLWVSCSAQFMSKRHEEQLQWGLSEDLCNVDDTAYIHTVYKQPIMFQSLPFILAAGQKKKPSSHLLASIPPAKICAASILFILYISSHMALVLDLNGFRHVDVAALQSPRGRAAEQCERIRFLLWKKGAEMTSGVVLLLHQPYSSIRNQSFDSWQH